MSDIKQDLDGFTKQMEDKFMKDLENIEIGDSDSELQSSTDFYEGLKKKLNSQITTMRAETAKNTILQELRTNINKELNNVEKFEQEIKQMKFLNSAAQSAIAQQKIEQIKTKLAKQNPNASKIVLADQVIETQQKQKSQVFFQQVEIEQAQKPGPQISNKKKVDPKRFQKKEKSSTINLQLEKKIAKANLQRQRIQMEREDQLSMKYEQHLMSEFFKERFLTFKMPKLQSTAKPFIISITKPKSTFTNLEPLPNNERNVLPKNSPEIALKLLKKSKKVALMPVNQKSIRIQFKKVAVQNTENISQTSKPQTELQNASNKTTESIRQLIEPYLKQISHPLNQLSKISEAYKPKFIRNYLAENEKISNICITDEKGGQKSVEQIMSQNQDFEMQDKKHCTKLKQFKLTFENVTSLKGIEKYQQVEYVALQFNAIKSIKQLDYCRKLIELQLSNNSIKQAKPIENLPQLRYLNMNSNKLRQFSFLGGSLQILNLKNNQIQLIIDLNRNKYLRIVDLSSNKLHDIGKGLSELYFLQQLNLQKNYIQLLNGSQTLIMLQKLNLSHNRIKGIQKPLIFTFLNYLDLSYNQIQKVPNVFLPSLQKFYFTNNKLTGEEIGKTTIYLPQLKELNLDDNQLKGFSMIWFFVRFSKNLQILKYDSNEYFLSVREKVRQLYEAIIYRNMKNLKILNHSPSDSGIKAYYESVYSGYLQKGSKIQKGNIQLQKIQQFISFLLEQNKMIYNLQSQNSKYRNQRFTEQSVFIESKSIKRANLLQKVFKTLQQNLIDGNTQTFKQQKRQSILLINQQIYHFHDRFQKNLLLKVHKIKSLFYRIKYKNQKKRKYFQSKKDVLSKLCRYISEKIKQNQVRKAIKAFSMALRKNRQQGAVIVIQKHWRGYKCRKLFRKMLKKLKQNADDSFEMEEVDLDEFQAQQLPQFNFDIPEDINFENYIIEPKYFEIATEQSKKRGSKAQSKLESIEEQAQSYKPKTKAPKMNNFMEEQQKSEQKKNKKQEDERLMKEWGFQNPATLEALRWRKKRKQQMKKKQAQQNMTAAQRYQRFKQIHK